MSKEYYPNELEEKFVINSNDRIAARLREYREEILKKREQNDREKLEKFLEELTYNEEGKPAIPVDDEGNYIVPEDYEGRPLINIDDEGNIISEPEQNHTESVEMEEPDVSPEEIIQNANIEAERIINEANIRCEAMLEHSREEGRKEGYNEGIAQGIKEYQDKLSRLQEEEKQLQEKFDTDRETMEKELVDVICDVIEKTFFVQFDDTREIILHLADNAIMKANASKTFIVRVSQNNHAMLLEKKDELLEKLGSEVILDIIADPLMEDDACLLETDGGIFNCGLDVQLQSVLKSIRLLNS